MASVMKKPTIKVEVTTTATATDSLTSNFVAATTKRAAVADGREKNAAQVGGKRQWEVL